MVHFPGKTNVGIGKSPIFLGDTIKMVVMLVLLCKKVHGWFDHFYFHP